VTTTARDQRPPLGPVVAASTLFLALTGLSFAVISNHGLQPAIILTLALTVVAAWHRPLFAWPTMLAAMVLVVMFIPMRRYALPGNLPFELEPYRLLIAFIAVGWGASLLVDPRVRFKHSRLDAPICTVLFVSAASIFVNADRLQSEHVSSDAIKQLTFLVSFVVVFYIIVGLVGSIDEVDRILTILVGAGGVVAVFAMIEVNTGFNAFNHLQQVFPFLSQTGDVKELTRSGRLRVFASSQHPIALGAMFALLIPIALYLSTRFAKRFWLGVIALLGLGAFATGSRTAIVMLVAVLGVYLLLRPQQTIRIWPALIPAVVLIHFAMPGALGGFYKSFFPKEGLVAEQADAPVGSSRVTSLGPGLHEIGLRPLLGSGYGAREFHGPEANSFIVDDQWLATGIETGILGVASWIWLFWSFLRRMFRAARSKDGENAALFLALAAAGTAFVVGMLTFDAFSFIQTTLVMFILMAVGCAALSFSGGGVRSAGESGRTEIR
jgi:polysaccharide biosynthesis protein PslJ